MEPAFSDADEYKTRDELARDLKKCRASVARLKKILSGQQSMLDIHKASFAELEAKDLRTEYDSALMEEMVERGRELEALNEELESRMVELNAQKEELQKTHKALMESQEKLRVAVDGASMGMWDWDLGTGELAWSDRCKKIFGLPSSAAIDYDAFILAIHPDDRERVDEAVKRALNNMEDYDVEMRVRWYDGTVRWIASRGHGFYADGKPVRMVGVAMDITGWKRSDKE